MSLRHLAGSPALELVNLVFEKRARGEKVVSLAIGDPSFDTPKEIVDVAYESMRSGDVHYVSSYGTLDVRTAIRDKVRKKNGIRAEVENCVFVTTKFSLYAALVSIAESDGFEVLVPDPGYFYSEPVILAGGKPVPYGLKPDFSLDLDQIRSRTSAKTRAIIVNTPSNPTSKVLSKKELADLYRFCLEKRIFIITDEAYEDLIYGASEHFSVGSLEQEPELVISIFSLSKSYAMTGWRSGYVVASKEMVTLLNKFLENTVSCFPPFIEKASAYALNNCDDQILEFRRKFKEKRDVMTEKIEKIKALELPSPIEGAFYAFPKIKGKPSSLLVAKKILAEESVATLPGISFGSVGEGHIRLSFSGPQEDIDEGMKRLEKFFRDYS